MARSTMSSLIGLLRGYTQASTADFSIGTVNYWSDNQLQEVLDRHRYEVRSETLQSFPVAVGGGSVQWRDYQSQYRWYEDSESGTARFIVQDSTGATVTSWTAQYPQGLITFNQNTGGTVYQLTGFAYDVYGAAADVWRQKAAQYATSIDFETDNHKVKRSHIMKNLDRMVDMYDAMSGVPYQSGDVATIYRGDTYPDGRNY